MKWRFGYIHEARHFMIKSTFSEDEYEGKIVPTIERRETQDVSGPAPRCSSAQRSLAAECLPGVRLRGENPRIRNKIWHGLGPR